jgi:galactose-1-phosphate uridylyltransferase
VNWKNTYKKKREQFVQEYFPKIEKSSAKILADEITKNIHFNSYSEI